MTIEPNPGIQAIAEAIACWYEATGGYPNCSAATVVKTQPPDGMVIELPDGSRWNIAAYPGVPLDVTHA